MADKTDDIRQEIKKGRKEIADTHAAITEKLASLEDRIQETVAGVKHTFDLQYQVKQHPWLLFGGAVLVGYMLAPRRGSGASARMNMPKSSSRGPAQPGVADAQSRFKGEIASIKGAAFGAVISTLWAMAKQVLLPLAKNIESPKSTAQPSDMPQQNTFRGFYP